MNEFEYVTYFYKPGMSRGLKMIDHKYQEGAEENINERFYDSDNSETDFRCFVGWKVDDVPYSEVIGIDSNRVELIHEDDLTISGCQQSVQASVLKISGPLLRVRTEPLPVELKTEIVTNWCFKRVLISKEAMRLGMTTSQIRNIIYEYQVLRKANRKIGRSLNNSRRKLEILHIEWLAEFVKAHQLNCFTRSDARACLLRSFPDLGNISLSSVGNVLHRNLGLSFKKLGGTNIKKVRPESQSNLIEWLKLLISLLNDQYYLVFIDEFIVNRQTQWTYGWTQKGKPGRMLIRAIDFKMSFIIAHSQVRVEGIIGTKSTFNQLKYKHFLGELASNLKLNERLDWSKVFIVADNWVFHRTNLIRQFLTQTKLRWLFIPPYSPELNAWEKLINFIKSKVKMMVGEQR